MGLCRKTEIDISYCEKQKIIQDFDSGYKLTGMRNILKELVIDFANKGIFLHGKRLENLDDSILHVEQGRSGVEYETEEDVSFFANRIFFQAVYNKKTRLHETGHCIPDFKANYRELKKLVDSVNKIEVDFRYQGKYLRNPYYLKYQTDRLKKRLVIQTPCNKINDDDLSKITFGTQEECSVIKIDYLYSSYMFQRLTKTKNMTFNTMLTNGRSNRTVALLIEKAWEVILKYGNNITQRNYVFRGYVDQYAHSRPSNIILNDFFDYLMNVYFNFQKAFSRIKWVDRDDFKSYANPKNA